MQRVPNVHLCLIAKNEVENLDYVLREARQFDSCLLVDTGSTDGTVEKAKEMGAKVVHFDWIDDFSAARNVWHEHIKDGWIFWLDGDDEIEPHVPNSIRTLTAMADDDVKGFLFVYRYPNDYRVDHIRLYRAGSNITWRSRIHEHLDFTETGTGRIEKSGLEVYHKGYEWGSQVEAKNRSERNMKLLLKMVEDEPDRALWYQYIAVDRAGWNKHEEACEWYDKCLARVKPDTEYYWLTGVYFDYAKSLHALGKKGKAKELLQFAKKNCPNFESHLNRMLLVKNYDGSTAIERGRRRRERIRSLP